MSASPPRRGDLVDCRVRVQRKVTVLDVLEHRPEWEDIGATEDRPVRYRHAHYAIYQSGQERIRQEAASAQEIITLTMDYFSGVDATCRVLFQGREDEPYEITTTPENLHNQRRTLILRVRRMEAG